MGPVLRDTMYITEIEFKQDNKGRNNGNLTLNIRTIRMYLIWKFKWSRLMVVCRLYLCTANLYLCNLYFRIRSGYKIYQCILYFSQHNNFSFVAHVICLDWPTKLNISSLIHIFQRLIKVMPESSYSASNAEPLADRHECFNCKKTVPGKKKLSKCSRYRHHVERSARRRTGTGITGTASLSCSRSFRLRAEGSWRQGTSRYDL